MSKTLVILLSLIISLISVSHADKPFSVDQSFGGQVPAEGEPLTLKEAIGNIGHVEDQFIKIEGQITEVCQAKGCWMILVEGDTYARVTFEDYGFFVPTETSMQRSVIYGKISERTLSGQQAEHFAQDAGSQSKIKLEGEIREYSILARGVQLENRS
jgi:hypothetical protein